VNYSHLANILTSSICEFFYFLKFFQSDSTQFFIKNNRWKFRAFRIYDFRRPYPSQYKTKSTFKSLLNSLFLLLLSNPKRDWGWRQNILLLDLWHLLINFLALWTNTFQLTIFYDIFSGSLYLFETLKASERQLLKLSKTLTFNQIQTPKIYKIDQVGNRLSGEDEYRNWNKFSSLFTNLFRIAFNSFFDQVIAHFKKLDCYDDQFIINTRYLIDLIFWGIVERLMFYWHWRCRRFSYWWGKSWSCYVNFKDLLLLQSWAADNSHLNVVQWLHYNRNEGCSWCNGLGCPSNGHLNVIQWLHYNRNRVYYTMHWIILLLTVI
jgi:hypothetical protein